MRKHSSTVMCQHPNTLTSVQVVDARTVRFIAATSCFDCHDKTDIPPLLKRLINAGRAVGLDIIVER